MCARTDAPQAPCRRAPDLRPAPCGTESGCRPEGVRHLQARHGRGATASAFVFDEVGNQVAGSDAVGQTSAFARSRSAARESTSLPAGNRWLSLVLSLAFRDGKFARHADELLRGTGTEPLLLPPRSPNLNGRAERWIRSARTECLDHIIILNERHLHWAPGELVRYYNARRPHRSLQLRPPEGPVAVRPDGKVVRRKILGGLISDYHREAG
jgi:hypothetical protein